MLEGVLYCDFFEFEKVRNVLLEVYKLVLVENDIDELVLVVYNFILLLVCLKCFEDVVYYGWNYLGYGFYYEVSIIYGDVIYLVV